MEATPHISTFSFRRLNDNSASLRLYASLYSALCHTALAREKTQPQQQPDSHLRTTYGLGTDRAQRKSPPPPKEIGKNTL